MSTEEQERTEDEPFGFKFEYREPYYDEEEPGWAVFLPHQSDEWTIAGGYWSGIPHAAAVAELERFIAEAQATLEKLRVATPIGKDEQGALTQQEGSTDGA